MLRLPAPRIADGFGICSAGAVRSVIVAHRHPLDLTTEILLDPSSRTSVHLLQILLAEHLKTPARLVGRSEDPLAARLIIGDPALRFQENKDPGWRIFDLGQAWHEWTGLPFVYAAWTLAENAPAGTADLLRQAAANGLAARAAIAAGEPDPPAALAYLKHSIHYPIGAAEREGLAAFRRCLLAQKLLPAEAGSPVFV